jgi:hypothetical protein
MSTRHSSDSSAPRSVERDEIFAQLEELWSSTRNPSLVDEFAAEHPAFAADLYEFFALLIGTESLRDDHDARASRVATLEWLEREGFEQLREITAEERNAGGLATTTSDGGAGPGASNVRNFRPNAAANNNKHNRPINEAVVLAALSYKFGSVKFPLGRVRRTKLSYLLHRHCEGYAEGFLKKAAGPYNPGIRYGGAEKIALKNGYVVDHISGKFNGFIAGPKIEEAKAYFDRWYGGECLDWLEQFRFDKTDQLELLTTVDVAIVELVSRGRAASLENVRNVLATNDEWAPKLTREVFSDENLLSAIDRACMIFPPD